MDDYKMDGFKVVYATSDTIEAGPYENALMDAAEAGDFSQMDAVFKKLKGDKHCKRITRTLEKSFVEDTVDMVKELKPLMQSSPDCLSNMFNGLSKPEQAEAKAETRVTIAMLLGFAQILGDAAHPLTKAVVTEMDKLSGKEKESAVKLVAMVVKAYDTAFPPKAAPKKKNKSGPKGHSA